MQNMLSPHTSRAARDTYQAVRFPLGACRSSKGATLSYTSARAVPLSHCAKHPDLQHSSCAAWLNPCTDGHVPTRWESEKTLCRSEYIAKTSLFDSISICGSCLKSCCRAKSRAHDQDGQPVEALESLRKTHADLLPTLIRISLHMLPKMRPGFVTGSAKHCFGEDTMNCPWRLASLGHKFNHAKI